MHRDIRKSAAALLFVLMVVPLPPAQAQVTKPFKISGSGVAPNGLALPSPDGPSVPSRHWIVGEATDLGRHYGEGTVVTDFAVPHPDLGTFTGEFGSGAPFVFVAANGDNLVTYYGRPEHEANKVGTFTLNIVGFTEQGVPIVKAAWIAEFVVQPELSTGRFRGVTGSWIMYAFSDPFVLGSTDPASYRWHGDGRLTFPNGKR